MNKDSDKIFNEILDHIHSGKSLNEAFSMYPNDKSEMEPEVKIALTLESMPKKTVPEPAMQRKYILAPATRTWVRFIHVSRWATLSMAIMMLAALLGGTGYAAEQSVPGDTLFTIKKAVEHLQIQLATNQVDKINLQVSIAQKRLSDAQQVLSNPQHDSAQENAAISELASETQNTADVLKQATQNNNQTAIAKNDSPLIASLNTITSQQQELLKNINSNGKTAVDQNVINDAKANITKVAAIKQSLEAAGSEGSLAKLQSNPAAVVATGTIVSLSDTNIKIGTQTFHTNSQTIYKQDNNTISYSDLKIQERVEISGDKTNDGSVIARQVTVIENSNPGEIKGAETGTGSPTSTNPGSGTTSSASSQNQTNNNPNTAVGSFIIEDPSPQTDFKQ